MHRSTGMLGGSKRRASDGKVHAGSWGMLMVGRRTARFLWFDDPRELLCAVLECVAPTGASKPARWRSLTAVDGFADEEERLHAFLLLEGLVKDINRREREYSFRVSWWGPLTDLQESEAPVPTMIRAWFHRRGELDPSSGEPVEGAIPGDQLPAFAEFLDRVSFGTEDLGEV